jgi:hypothetical protein
MRRRCAGFLACASPALAAAHVEDYARKPVNINVPFAVGGPADVHLARRLLALLADPARTDGRAAAGFEPVRRMSGVVSRRGGRHGERQGGGARARPAAPSPSVPDARPPAGGDWTFVTSGIASRAILRSAISFCVGDSDA